VAYLAWLERERRSALLATWLLALAALLSKESAVMLFVSLPVLDLLADRGARLRTRWRRLRPFIALPFVYFGLRLLVLGSLIGQAAPEGVAQVSLIQGSLLKALALFWPHGYFVELAQGASSSPVDTDLWQYKGLTVFAFSILSVWIGGALGWAGRDVKKHSGASTLLQTLRLLAVPLLLALWALAHTLPSLNLAITPELTGSRLIYGAVLVPALLAGGIAASLAGWGPKTLIAAFFVPAWIAILGHRQQLYVQAWDKVADIQTQLLELAKDSSPSRPLAIAGIPSRHEGVPLINANAAFPLVQRPFANQDHVLLGLDCVMERFRGSEELYHDALPIAQLVRSGGRVAFWLGDRFHVVAKERERMLFMQPRASGSDIARPLPAAHFNAEHPTLPIEFERPLDLLEPWQLFLAANRSVSGRLVLHVPGQIPFPHIEFTLSAEGPIPTSVPIEAPTTDFARDARTRYRALLNLDHDIFAVGTSLQGGLGSFHLELDAVPEGFELSPMSGFLIDRSLYFDRGLFVDHGKPLTAKTASTQEPPLPLAEDPLTWPELTVQGFANRLAQELIKPRPADLEEHAPWRSLPAEGVPLLLLGPHAGHRVQLRLNETGDGAAPLDPELIQIFDNIARASRVRYVYAFFDRQPGYPHTSGMMAFRLLPSKAAR
jgi:hypothetical protein